MTTPAPALISVDWGTTSMRCALLNDKGSAIEHRGAGPGIMRVSDGDFPGALTAAIGDWRSKDPSLTVIMSGMIGSRQGWVEAPYLPCPATISEIARGIIPIDTVVLGRIHLIPGLAIDQPGQNPDVMRGEETQIVGALQADTDGTRIFVLPGTHSKWATTNNGAITGFATYMTGEVFAALRHHTILGRLMPQGETPFDPAAFDRGVAEGITDGPPDALLHRLFSTRTLGLFDRLPAAALESYLSGLLIGAEITAATQHGEAAPNTAITIIGNDMLSERYLRATTALHRMAHLAPTDCAARGHLALARAAKLVG